MILLLKRDPRHMQDFQLSFTAELLHKTNYFNFKKLICNNCGLTIVKCTYKTACF